MTGRPWSRSASAFTVKGRYFRSLPGPDGIELQRWAPEQRRWELLGVFPSRPEARAEARRVTGQEH